MRFISKKLEWSGFNSLLANLHERKYDDFRNLFFICKLAPTDAHDAHHDERKTLSFTMVSLNIPNYIYFLRYSSLNQPMPRVLYSLNAHGFAIIHMQIRQPYACAHLRTVETPTVRKGMNAYGWINTCVKLKNCMMLLLV